MQTTHIESSTTVKTPRTTARARSVASLLLLAGSLLALTPQVHADDMRTILGGGVGAAAGTILGQSMGGRSGAVIGGALGGATGAAVTTRGRGQNGAVLGGALGGAAGATIGRGVGRDNYYQHADYQPDRGYRARGGYDRWDNRRGYERSNWREERYDRGRHYGYRNHHEWDHHHRGHRDHDHDD